MGVARLLPTLIATLLVAPGCMPRDDFVVPSRPPPLPAPTQPPDEDSRARELLEGLRERLFTRPFYAVASLHVRRPGIERHVLLRLHHRSPGHAFLRADRPPRDRTAGASSPSDPPLREQGMAALRVDGRVRVWFPAAEVQVDLPPSLGGDRLLGSDITYDDLLALGGGARGFVATYVAEEDRVGERCHHLRLVPSTPAVSLLDRIELWIAVADGLPLAQESHTRRAGLVRSLEMRRGASTQLPLPIHWTARTGTSGAFTSELDFRLFEFDPPVDADLFTLEGLTRWS
jgi:hypothetical protein